MCIDKMKNRKYEKISACIILTLCYDIFIKEVFIFVENLIGTQDVEIFMVCR